jgi:hypothetical protein
VKILLVSFCFFVSGVASAQWAVYDHRVYQELRRINEVRSVSIPDQRRFDELQGLSDLNVDFASVALADRTRFITTQEDCGDERLNRQHFAACQGLRNLRLKTLEQSEELLTTIRERRRAINRLLEESRRVTEVSGRLQRYQFELQGIQALMQSDAMRLEVLMSAYKQREKMYEVQMVEARRVTDTQRPGAIRFGAVPFDPGLIR